MRRRDFICGALASATCSARGLHARKSSKNQQNEKCNTLLIIAGGGIDTILTMDPKTRSQVNSRVDIPYSANQLFSKGDLQVGPLMKPLVPWLDRCAILRGMHAGSVAHQPAISQINVMRRGVVSKSTKPSLMDLISASAKDGRPAVNIRGFPTAPSTNAVNSKLVFEKLMHLPESELLAVANRLSHLAGDAEKRGGAQWSLAATRLRGTSELCNHMAKVPRPLKIVEPSPKRLVDADWLNVDHGPEAIDAYFQFSSTLQQALWLFKNGVTSNVRLMYYAWDSHVSNTKQQASLCNSFFLSLAEFLKTASETRVGDHTLLDETRIVVLSELGRYPILNKELGKHHFPEIPALVIGKNVNGGRAFGGTKPDMAARPISPKDGLPSSKGGHLLSIDDLGTTLLYASGVKHPELYGYHGRRMGFLL